MPHIIIEVSQNIAIADSHRLLKQVNQALFAMGHFQNADDIKTRLYRPVVSIAGIEDKSGFVAITVKLLSGRTQKIKDELAQLILYILKDEFIKNNTDNPSIQYSVEIIELSSSYHKVVV